MNASLGGARRDAIPWPDSPFLKAVRRAGHEDRFFALALCRADVKQHVPDAYTADPPMAARSASPDPLRPSARRTRTRRSRARSGPRTTNG